MSILRAICELQEEEDDTDAEDPDVDKLPNLVDDDTSSEEDEPEGDSSSSDEAQRSSKKGPQAASKQTVAAALEDQATPKIDRAALKAALKHHLNQPVRYHSATVRVYMPDTGIWLTFIADTGASVSLLPWQTMTQCATSWQLLPSISRLKVANGGGMNVQGRSPLSFKTEGSDKLWNHNMEIIAGGTAPNILGVDFWTEHKANFCLVNKEITLTHPDGDLVKIPVSVHKPDEAVRIAAVSTEDYCRESRVKAAHSRVAGKLRATIRVKAAARAGCSDTAEEPL